jgi:hypothetical protein
MMLMPTILPRRARKGRTALFEHHEQPQHHRNQRYGD